MIMIIVIMIIIMMKCYKCVRACVQQLVHLRKEKSYPFREMRHWPCYGKLSRQSTRTFHDYTIYTVLI